MTVRPFLGGPGWRLLENPYRRTTWQTKRFRSFGWSAQWRLGSKEVKGHARFRACLACSAGWTASLSHSCPAQELRAYFFLALPSWLIAPSSRLADIQTCCKAWRTKRKPATIERDASAVQARCTSTLELCLPRLSTTARGTPGSERRHLLYERALDLVKRMKWLCRPFDRGRDGGAA